MNKSSGAEETQSNFYNSHNDAEIFLSSFSLRLEAEKNIRDDNIDNNSAKARRNF